ncbi:uncharacterized protein LOC128548300 [Mercenaria mercenaria]|uniref:uncharacterized protein LOC128548300 n=1 Tax=Mercenaria mercenaria TaxID=6596 RepID=UPI00234FB2FC|nr:uncharacterized protein LOC128548300 [Mercenaria mercenaria]
METMFIVILLVGCVAVDAHAGIDNVDLAAVIDSLDAVGARSDVEEDELSSSTVDARMYGNKESCAVKNVALHKPAKASSTYSRYSLANLAVDGNLEQRFSGGSGGSKTYCFFYLGHTSR